MKILFMGTPDIAATSLEGLIADGTHEIAMVVTQPDRPKGRSGKLAFSDVKEVAVRENIPVYQPERMKNQESIEYLKQFSFDIGIVVAFGQILPKEILDLPKYGCVNLHASLLPKWRGAGPIQWSILAGDEKTGLTTMQMDEGLDTGDMLLVKEVPITEDETGGSLFDRLASMGSSLLLETMKKIEDGTITRTPQNHEESTYAKMLSKSMGELDFTKPAVELERYIRGLNPWPSAYTKYQGKTLKIWKAKVTDGVSGKEPGEIVKIDKNSFTIQTGEDALTVLELQLEGKKRMQCGDFLRGVKVEKGMRL